MENDVNVRFIKPVQSRINEFLQESDAQLAFRLQNEEFEKMYDENRENRRGKQMAYGDLNSTFHRDRAEAEKLQNEIDNRVDENVEADAELARRFEADQNKVQDRV